MLERCSGRYRIWGVITISIPTGRTGHAERNSCAIAPERNCPSLDGGFKSIIPPSPSPEYLNTSMIGVSSGLTAVGSLRVPGKRSSRATHEDKSAASRRPPPRGETSTRAARGPKPRGTRSGERQGCLEESDWGQKLAQGGAPPEGQYSSESILLEPPLDNQIAAAVEPATPSCRTLFPQCHWKLRQHYNSMDRERLCFPKS